AARKGAAPATRRDNHKMDQWSGPIPVTGSRDSTRTAGTGYLTRPRAASVVAGWVGSDRIHAVGAPPDRMNAVTTNPAIRGTTDHPPTVFPLTAEIPCSTVGVRRSTAIQHIHSRPGNEDGHKEASHGTPCGIAH